MALLKDSGGGGKAVAPPPRRKLPAPSKPASPAKPAPSRRLGAVRQLPPSERGRGPVVREQARPQQPFRMPASRENVIASYEPAAALASIFERKPTVVEVVPERKATPSPEPQDWINRAMNAPAAEIWSSAGSENRRMQMTGNMAERLNMQAQRGQRDLRRRDRESNDRQETASALTAEQWAAYTPLQQAAVQANADLAQAIQRDFDSGAKHSASGEQVKSYQDRAKALFGEDYTTGFKGLEYAPNTVAFLDSRGIEAADLAGKTLDDFISGDALMSAELIDSLGKESKVPRRGRNIALAQSLAKGQLAYQEKLAQKLQQGEQLLSGLTSRETTSAAGESFGANTVQPDIKLDKIQPETAEVFDMYIEALARTDIPIDEALESVTLDLQQRGATPEETSQVWEGMLERSRLAVTGQGEWFPGVDFPMRSPVEVAQALGAPTLKRQAMQTAGEK